MWLKMIWEMKTLSSDIVLYSKSKCPNCVKAKNLLDSVGISYKTILVDEDESALKFLLSEGHKAIPQIYKDGKLFVQGGYQGLYKMWQQGSLK